MTMEPKQVTRLFIVMVPKLYNPKNFLKDANEISLGIQIGVGEYVSASVLNAVETIHKTGTNTNSAMIIKNTYRSIPFIIFFFVLVIFQHHPIKFTDQVTNYKYDDSPSGRLTKSKVIESRTINI